MSKKLIFIFILIIFVLFSPQLCSAYEFDIVAPVTQIIDGDSFYIQGDEVRLADVNCPEYNEVGGSIATDALTLLIDGQIVYLDTDQQTGRDPYGRLVAVVYVVLNETHFYNVNEYMLLLGHAELTDYTNNEFDPYTWSLFERFAWPEPETSSQPAPEPEEPTPPSSEDEFYAVLTDVDYPSSGVDAGTQFSVEIFFDYRFDREVEFNPVIWDWKIENARAIILM